MDAKSKYILLNKMNKVYTYKSLPINK